jgi:hypothetical protein
MLATNVDNHICGSTINNAYMQHSLLALVVIPELRTSDIGLVDGTLFKKVGCLFEGDGAGRMLSHDLTPLLSLSAHASESG